MRKMNTKEHRKKKRRDMWEKWEKEDVFKASLAMSCISANKKAPFSTSPTIFLRNSNRSSIIFSIFFNYYF
jgi:hypothetical protein